MINVGLYYRVKPGHKEEFEKTFTQVLDFLKKNMNGFSNAKSYKTAGDPREYLIYSECDPLEAFTKFILSRKFSATTNYNISK